jgi:hypothetical protein
MFFFVPVKKAFSIFREFPRETCHHLSVTACNGVISDKKTCQDYFAIRRVDTANHSLHFRVDCVEWTVQPDRTWRHLLDCTYKKFTCMDEVYVQTRSKCFKVNFDRYSFSEQ